MSYADLCWPPSWAHQETWRWHLSPSLFSSPEIVDLVTSSLWGRLMWRSGISLNSEPRSLYHSPNNLRKHIPQNETLYFTCYLLKCIFFWITLRFVCAIFSIILTYEMCPWKKAVLINFWLSSLHSVSHFILINL